MKKRTNKRTAAESGSKLYRKRIARLAGLRRNAQDEAEQGFDGVMEPVGVLSQGEPTIIGEGVAAEEAGISCPVATPPKASSRRKTIIWVIISLGIAVLSIWAVTSQNKHFSFKFFLRRLEVGLHFLRLLHQLLHIGATAAVSVELCHRCLLSVCWIMPV